MITNIAFHTFFFFSTLTLSYTMQCESPLKHAPPVSNAKLVSFALFLRHGIRTPVYTHKYLSRSEVGTWICDSEDSEAPRNHFSIYPNIDQSFSKISRRYFNQLDTNLVEYPINCQAGDLLIEGMRQHYELGQFYQKYLIHELHFLPRLIHTEYMDLRSSYVERTFRSGESFMAGLYPPVLPNESITFTTGSDSLDYLTIDASFCADLQKDINKFGQSKELTDRINENRILYKEIYEALNSSVDESNWRHLGDILGLAYCTNQKFPKAIEHLITEEIFNRSQTDSGFYYYKLYSVRKGVSSAPIFRDLFSKLDEKGTSKRFFLFSAHDTTLASILSTLGYTDDKLPTFRSHLAFEIWEKPEGSGKKYIRVVMNGDEVNIGDEDEIITLMEYNAFKEKLAKIGINNYCPEYPF